MFQPFFHPLRHSLLNDGKKLDVVQSAIVSIERAGGSFTFDTFYRDYTISEVDLNFAVIYDHLFSTSWNNARALTRKTFLDSTTVRAQAGGDVTSYTLTPRFFVVEFDHTLIKSVQHVTPTFPDSDVEEDVIIASVDVDKTQIISAGWYVEKDIYDVRPHNVQMYLIDSTTLRMWRANAVSNDALYMSIFLLEFK